MSNAAILSAIGHLVNPMSNSHQFDPIWAALTAYYRERRDIGLDDVIRQVWERDLQFPCWVLDGVAGTHPPIASQFTQAAGADKIVTSKDHCNFFARLSAALGGKISYGIHTGLYYDSPEPVEWDKLGYDHFRRYVLEAKALGCSIGYHPTLFNHPLAAEGNGLATLSSANEDRRRFFVDHVKATLRIAQQTASILDRRILVNIWAIDGNKADVIDRLGPRQRMRDSLEEIEEYTAAECPNVVVSIEFKLTAPETEEYTVGSLEFLQGVAQKTGLLLTLDLGHSWPGRDWGDLASSLVANEVQLAVHVSRGRYSDADLTVTYTTALQEFFTELERCGIADETWVGLDTFDPRVDPFAALVVSGYSVRAAQVIAALDPTKDLRNAALAGDEGIKLYAAGFSQFLTPALIIARAKQLFDLPDPFQLLLRE